MITYNYFRVQFMKVRPMVYLFCVLPIGTQYVLEISSLLTQVSSKIYFRHSTKIQTFFNSNATSYNILLFWRRSVENHKYPIINVAL